MGEMRSLDDMLSQLEGLSEAEVQKLKNERILGATAVLLQQRGHTDAVGLLTEVVALELAYQGQDWNIDQLEAILDVEPHLTEQFTDEVKSRIENAMDAVLERDNAVVARVRIRPLIPRVSTDWRQQLKAATGPQQSNQARRVRLEPRHPLEDSLHFSNEWEHRVYILLRERQATLPDNETIGIVPLSGMRVRGHTYEPDLLITYRGRVGIIEIDGPHHKGRRSDDASRERLLRNAGVKHIDRLDVQDSTDKAEVEKFLTDFLKHLAS